MEKLIEYYDNGEIPNRNRERLLLLEINQHYTDTAASYKLFCQNNEKLLIS